jgi:hypothetical protein
MSNILTIGYIGEGTTDKRFLGNIIKRTFEKLAFQCKGQIEVYEPQFFEVRKMSFADQSLKAAEYAKWLNVLCIHTDADDKTDNLAFKNKITPAIHKIIECEEDVCRNIIAIVPIHMTESWMLADIELLIDEIGSEKSNQALMLPTKIKQIEGIKNPKETIENAINIAFADQPARRRRGLTLSDLYSPLSQKISLEKLVTISSFQKFYKAAENALKELNY